MIFVPEDVHSQLIMAWCSLYQIQSIKPRSHCPVVRPGAPRQFVAGGPGRTGTNREGTQVRSYIPGSATDQTRF